MWCHSFFLCDLYLGQAASLALAYVSRGQYMERIEGGRHGKSICVAVEARVATTVPFTFVCCIGGRFPVGPLQLTLTT